MGNKKPIGIEWEDVKDRYTAEEIIECSLRVALVKEIIAARQEKKLTQRDMEALSGVKQPVIARMENGSNVPNVNTLLRLLLPLGKTLYIGDLPTDVAKVVNNPT